MLLLPVAQAVDRHVGAAQAVLMATLPAGLSGSIIGSSSGLTLAWPFHVEHQAFEQGLDAADAGADDRTHAVVIAVKGETGVLNGLVARCTAPYASPDRCGEIAAPQNASASKF